MKSHLCFFVFPLSSRTVGSLGNERLPWQPFDGGGGGAGGNLVVVKVELFLDLAVREVWVLFELLKKGRDMNLVF